MPSECVVCVTIIISQMLFSNSCAVCMTTLKCFESPGIKEKKCARGRVRGNGRVVAGTACNGETERFAADTA